MKTQEDLDRERRVQQYKADLEWLLSNPSGRRIVVGLLRHGGMFMNSFTRASAHGGTTEFYEGMRQMALLLYGDMKKFAPSHLKIVLEELTYEGNGDSGLF